MLVMFRQQIGCCHHQTPSVIRMYSLLVAYHRIYNREAGLARQTRESHQNGIQLVKLVYLCTKWMEQEMTQIMFGANMGLQTQHCSLLGETPAPHLVYSI